MLEANLLQALLRLALGAIIEQHRVGIGAQRSDDREVRHALRLGELCTVQDVRLVDLHELLLKHR